MEQPESSSLPPSVAESAQPAGPSAAPGSVVLPPKEGVPNRYSEYASKEADNIRTAAHAKDTAVSTYLRNLGVDAEEFRAASEGQRQAWAKEVSKTYKGYSNPDRIEDLATMLTNEPPDPGAILSRRLEQSIELAKNKKAGQYRKSSAGE